MRADEALIGARVRALREASPDMLAIELAGGDLRGTLLLGIDDPTRGVGWTEGRVAGVRSSPFLLKLRKHLDGARVTAIDMAGSLLRVHMQRGDERFVLEALCFGRGSDALLRRADGQALARLRSPLKAGTQNERLESPDDAEAEPFTTDLSRLRIAGERLLSCSGQALLDRKRDALTRALRGQLRKAERKLAAIEGDLARSDEVPRLRNAASLLVSHHEALPRGASEVTLLDYYAEPPQPVTLRFAPELGAKLQAEAWFRRARKLERGAAIARERAVATRARLQTLHALLARLAHVLAEADLDAIAAEANRLGVAASGGGPAAERGAAPARLPYRHFVGTGERAILVGKGSQDNDRLTLDHARPYDLWLHARDVSGAHVVVPLSREEACASELLVDAATLAAHFSSARGEELVDVLYTPRRYLRKPRKSAIGQVSLLREKVLRLRVETARLQRLLDSELQATGSVVRR
jgi:predicted ribosome quality control (RQC) complex YloA/Tae2 family protein